MPPLRLYPWLLLGVLPVTAQTPANGVPDLELLYQDGAAAYTKGSYDEAIKQFELLVRHAPPGPTLEGIYFAIGNARLLSGDNEGAVAAFGNFLRLYPLSEQAGDARIGATRALIAVGRMDDARRSLAALEGLRTGRGLIDNYGVVLGVAIQLADELFKAGKKQEALEIIQGAPTRDQILIFQKRRVEQLTARHAAAQAAVARAGAMGASTRLTAARDEAATRLADAKSALEQAEKNTSLDLPILLRQARCYLELDRPWHAVVVFRDVLARFPTEPDRVYAQHGLIYAYRQLGQSERTLQLCEDFLTTFPKHALTGEVSALAGDVATRMGRMDKANEFFGVALDQVGALDPAMRERVLFQQADTYFQSQDWARARAAFERFATEYPQAELIENARYLAAISSFLAADYEKAEKALKAYVAAYPEGTYKEDAAYRLAVCRFAYQEYARVVAACEDWEKRFPAGELLGQVRSLKGDAYAALEKPDEALAAYLDAVAGNPSEEVMEYVLGEIASLLEKKRDWAKMAEVFTARLEREPDSAQALRWTYWVSRAKARSGDVDGAAAFITSRLAPSFSEPRANGVEQLITLLAQVVARQKIPEGGEDIVAVFGRRLAEAGVTVTDALPAARMKFFEARLLALRRKPAESLALLRAIGKENDAQMLPVVLLAECGDALLSGGDAARAAEFYDAILKWFPNSDQRDFAHVGLGNIALAAGDIAKALEQFDAAIDQAGAPNKLREATVGRARALFELGRLKDSAALFEQIAGTREWRGESTALSLYYLGRIAAQENDQAKAIAFYRRVFVSQGRYPDWVAKAYLESAAAFEKLGKPADALATYREMAKNPRMEGRDELVTARIRMNELERTAPAPSTATTPAS